MNVSIYLHCTGNSCKKRSVKVHGVWGEVVRFPDLLWEEDIHWHSWQSGNLTRGLVVLYHIAGYMASTAKREVKSKGIC